MFNLRNVLLTAHILAAIVTIGWLSMQAMVIPGAIRRAQGPAVRFGATVARKVGPMASIVFLLGIWLVLRDANDGIEFSDKWVGLAMVLFIVAIVNGAVFIGRAEERAADKLEAGEPAVAEGKRVAMLGGLNMLILTVIVYLMVAKPT
jgi:hypothetical protein